MVRVPTSYRRKLGRRLASLILKSQRALSGMLALTLLCACATGAESRKGPGRELTDLGALDPAFRVCFEGLLKDLRAEGWRPVVVSTWRDRQRQQFYKQLGDSQTAHSNHCRTGPNGRPAARAVDVERGDVSHWMIPDQASFYQALRKAAPRHGLITGGTWARSKWYWALYDLGWDPGHVEAQPGQCGSPP
jgi:hypothetical protein